VALPVDIFLWLCALLAAMSTPIDISPRLAAVSRDANATSADNLLSLKRDSSGTPTESILAAAERDANAEFATKVSLLLRNIKIPQLKLEPLDFDYGVPAAPCSTPVGSRHNTFRLHEIMALRN